MSDAPAHDAEVEEIAADRRAEWRLIPQALLSLAVVVVIVVVREMLLR
ncbi:hypothetical protein [Microbacterium sp. BLY]|nr:hypothetical protein [Microbacterium sp. BLY]MBP3977659.1 hypothetical protein [Microbacterium sp. BLY]